MTGKKQPGRPGGDTCHKVGKKHRIGSRNGRCHLSQESESHTEGKTEFQESKSHTEGKTKGHTEATQRKRPRQQRKRKIITGKRQPGGPCRLGESGKSRRKLEEVAEMEGAIPAKLPKVTLKTTGGKG